MDNTCLGQNHFAKNDRRDSRGSWIWQRSTTGYCIEGHYMFHIQTTEQMFPSNDRAQVFLDVVASRFLKKKNNKNQTKTKPTNPHKRSPKQTNQAPHTCYWISKR